MSHSPEPWKYFDRKTRVGNYREHNYGIEDSNNENVCFTSLTNHEDSGPCEDDMHRIVACVNFCREFPTEFLVGKQLIAGEVRTIEVDQ